MKSSNLNAPRTMAEAHFSDLGCAIERVMPVRRRANWWLWAGWGVAMLFGLVLLAAVGRA